jgi:hypothetical protein
MYCPESVLAVGIIDGWLDSGDWAIDDVFPSKSGQKESKSICGCFVNQRKCHWLDKDVWWAPSGGETKKNTTQNHYGNIIEHFGKGQSIAWLCSIWMASRRIFSGIYTYWQKMNFGFIGTLLDSDHFYKAKINLKIGHSSDFFVQSLFCLVWSAKVLFYDRTW